MGAAETSRDQILGLEKGVVKATVQPYLPRAEKQKEGLCKVNVNPVENSVED